MPGNLLMALTLDPLLMPQKASSGGYETRWRSLAQVNMKRCILDPKLMRQLRSALLCQGTERTVQAHGTLIVLVLWEDDREM